MRSNLLTQWSFARLSNSSLMVAALAFIAVIGAPVQAQNDKMTPIATPSQPNAIEVGTGPLPGAKSPESWHSQYDPFFANGGYGLIDSWKAAKHPVEFHLYEQGGHGFGMYPKETTSTGWFEAFVRWIGMHGMLKPVVSGTGSAAK